MDAEIRFFMTHTDEAEFLAFANKHIDEIKQGSSLKQENSPEQKYSAKQSFIVGDCELFFTPTVIENHTMYSGVLEIRIENSNTACKNQLRANATYKKLRNWIKKKYWSRLAYINKTKKDKLMPTRIHWLAPKAKKWKEEDSEKHILKLSKTSWMVFDIGF
ncbi:MAG: hypothetical protein L3J51_04535 [Cocleimonas sp.]|nr:hypothetical protein [Cocleimonas sp.]